MPPATWHEAENRSPEHPSQHPRITGALWLALLKFSSGEWNVSAAERDVLLAYGLICKEQDRLVLSAYGRKALELSS
jgi:hypothetical protein